MFDFIRKRSDRKGLGVYIIFGALVVVFALFGYNTMNHREGVGVAARVNTRAISLLEYKDAYENAQAFYSQIFGPDFANDPQRQSMLRRQALEQLIQQESAYQQASELGVYITPLEVRETLVKIPAFQDKGKFQRERYENFLRYKQTDAGRFEDQLKRDLSGQKIRRFWTAAMFGTQSEAQRTQNLRNTKVNVEFLRFDPEAATTQIAPRDAEIQSFLAKPEAKKRAEEFYALNKSQFTQEEQVRARHILVKATSNKPEDLEAARKRAEGIKERAKNEDFAKLASEVSEDVGSKSQGGDLGTFAKGRMVPEFEKAAFSLEPGKVSDLVQSSFGFHLIRVEEKFPAKTTSFEEAAPRIATRLISEDRYREQLGDLEALVKKGEATAIEGLAKKMNVKWEETGEFSLSDETYPKIGSVEAVADAVSTFNETKKIFPQVLMDGSKRYVVRVKLRQQSNSNPTGGLAAVEKQLSEERGREAYGAWVETAVKASAIERNPNLAGPETDSP